MYNYAWDKLLYITRGPRVLHSGEGHPTPSNWGLNYFKSLIQKTEKPSRVYLHMQTHSGEKWREREQKVCLVTFSFSVIFPSSLHVILLTQFFREWALYPFVNAWGWRHLKVSDKDKRGCKRGCVHAKRHARRLKTERQQVKRRRETDEKRSEMRVRQGQININQWHQCAGTSCWSYLQHRAAVL